jgi:hypothetical protein
VLDWLWLLLVVLLLAAAALFLRIRKKEKRRKWPVSQDYPSAQWKQNPGRMNFSSFVYFDVDRDGVYGLADRPMGGIVARLSDGSGTVAATRTNSAGFANFPMSTRRQALIRRPGSFEFAVSVPPGWAATSGNAVQRREISSSPGSITGLAAENMLVPVGLAPQRFVTGDLGQVKSATASAYGDGQLLVEERIGGRFRLDLPESATRLTITADGHELDLMVGPYPIDLGRVDFLRLVPKTVAGRTFSFDGVADLGLRKVPSGYAGLDWFNLNALRNDHYANAHGYVNGNSMGSHVAYMSSGHPAEISSEKPFDFLAMTVAVAWLKAEGETVMVEIWDGENLVRRDAIVLSALCPISYTPMVAGVTRLRLSTLHSWQAVIGDLTVSP